MKKIFLLFLFGINSVYASEGTMRYEQDCFDLETGTVNSSLITMNCDNEKGDFKLAYNAGYSPGAVVFQNQCVGQNCEKWVEIAHSTEGYEEVSFTDITSLNFTRNLIDAKFSGTTVILHTADDHYYKLWLVEEVSCDNSLCVKFKWDQLTGPSNGECGTVVYSTANRKITFDTLAIELYNPITDESKGQFGLFNGADMNLEMLPSSFYDFKYAGGSPTYTGKVVEESNDCHPTYFVQKEMVRFPRIKIPLVGILLDGNTVDGPVACYSAVFWLSTVQAGVFSLKEVNEVTCE